MAREKVLPVRLMMSGSCHPHSGKIISFSVPVLGGSNRSGQDVINEVFIAHWPQKDIPVDFEAVTLMLLKTGIRHDLSKPFESYFSSSELSLAVDPDSESTIQADPTICEDPKKASKGDVLESALMHIVFRRKKATPTPGEGSGSSATTEDDKKQEKAKTGSACCAAM